MDDFSAREERDFHNLTVRPRRMHLLDEPSGYVSALAKDCLAHQMRFSVGRLESELLAEDTPHVLQIAFEGGDDRTPAIWTLYADGDAVAHAEPELMRRASQVYTKEEMWDLTMYNCGEPCAMCSGAIYWGNLGRLVYIGRESTLKKYTGDDIRNPTLALPCRAIFACGQKPDMELVGPVPELEEEYMKLHEGFWHPSEE